MEKQIVRIGMGIALVVVFLLHAAKWIELPLIQRLEAIVYDTRLSLTMPRTLDPRIVILDIDEKSLAEKEKGGEGRWPWPRDTMAQIMDRLFNDLLAPKVDWREQLREFVTSICRARDTSSWRRVNRRYIGQDIYMPSLIGETIGPIVIGIDTSGSIEANALRTFMSEVKAIAEEVKPERVHLMYWDTKVAAHEVYEQGQLDGLVATTRPKGGGGTNPTCVLDYIKQNSIKPECIIILTDGEVGNDWGTDWPAPVLWVIAGRKDIVAPNGKTIYIND